MRDSISLSRRQFLHYCAAGGGYLLLSACRTPMQTPTAESISRATIVVTPSELLALPTPRLSPTPPPSLTPHPTLIPLQPTAIATQNGLTIYLPAVNQAVAEAYPAAVAAQPTKTPIVIPLPTLTPTPRPTATPTPVPCLTPAAPPPEVAPPYIGLHASADPVISAQERCTFLDLRPSVIKIMTFHPPVDIAPLAASQPTAHWIVRAFLEFGGRNVSAENFVNWTLGDMVRTVNVLGARDITIELHNEPNLVAEGWQTTWADGKAFAEWWLQVLAQYRAALPGARYLYPGLSPGGDVGGVRRDHFTFMEESRAAVESADGIGLHLYWSADYSMTQALGVLDETIARFPNRQIWITEASYNASGISDEERARQYLALIAALRARPAVQAVTFFVASASDVKYSAETWVGRSIAKILGNR